MLDRKGILSFLAITFGVTYAIEGALILAGWIHGAFNGQAYGAWRVLFPNVNPLLGGLTGLVGIVVGLAVVHRGRAVA
jgi:hypothetical protein